MKNLRLNIRQIALMGMLVAISVALDMFNFYQLGNGGSINSAMVGLVIIALSFGWWQTWLAIAIVYGMITAFLDGWFSYYLFDYFLALSGFVVISIMRKSIITSRGLKGIVILTVTFLLAFGWRLLMHVISGVLFFPVNWAGSFAYNISYLLPSFLISYAVISGLYFSSLPAIIRKITLKKMV